MIAFLEIVLSFVLVLGILVFVHEFGHFLFARLFGISVPVFSFFGIGPRLFGFSWRGTDFRVSAVPLGGYVRLAGEEAEDRTGAGNEMQSKPRWQRLIVFVAGATFNLALAVLIMWGVFWAQGAEDFPSAPVVAGVKEGSPAESAGLQRGDKVLSIKGRDAREPATFIEEIDLSPDSKVNVEIERGGKSMEVQLATGVSREGGVYRGDPGWMLLQEGVGPTTIFQVLPGSPAEKAGLKTGDKVLGAEGRRPIGEVDLRGLLAASAGKEVRLEIGRGAKTLEVRMTPHEEGGRGVIGVVFRTPGIHRDLSAGQALVEAVKWNASQANTIFVALKRLATKPQTVRNFTGPIGIARLSRAAVTSLESFLFLLALISLNLGILNLLPIPVLDGGHILILCVEGIARRDLSEAVKERVMQAGLVFLLLFFGAIIYFDVIKTFFSS